MTNPEIAARFSEDERRGAEGPSELHAVSSQPEPPAAVDSSRDERAELQSKVRELRSKPLEYFAFSESGNGDRFASRFGDRVRCDTSGRTTRWYIAGADNRWTLDTTGGVERMARHIVSEMLSRGREIGSDGLIRWAERSDTMTAMHNMTMSGALHHGLLINADTEFDARPDILVCKDTVVELHGDGITTRPLLRDDMAMRSTGVEYEPSILDGPPEMITNYLDTFIPDHDVRRNLFTVLGSSLGGANKDRLFPTLYGPSTTGKSQFSDALQLALGGYAGTASASLFHGNMEDKPRPDLLRLLPLRMAFLPEASSFWELHGDRLKDITGGGKIIARGMSSNDFAEVRPQFMPVLVTNEMPMIKGIDTAVLRRMCVIEFKHRPVSEDPTISDRFKNDPDVQKWLLARLIQGYVDGCHGGVKRAAETFAVSTSEMYASLTQTGQFLEFLRMSDLLTEGYAGPLSHCASLGDMHTVYVEWVKRHGSDKDWKNRLGIQQFSKAMVESHGWEQRKSGSWRWVGKILKTAKIAELQWEPLG